MTQTRTYLDYNATAPMRDEARAAMAEALAIHGNPSSVHMEGRRARAAVERARAQVAALAGCEPREVIFTSGGSEANTAVLMQPHWDRLAVSATEHDSVLAPARASGKRCDLVPVSAQGAIDLERLRDTCAGTGAGTDSLLVSVQLANNETGVIQLLEEVARAAADHGAALHTDAVQAAGRLPLDFARIGVDYMSLSAHKLGGPKGVGALIVRTGSAFRPAVHGGGQETNRRAGTENVAGIVGFGVAAEIAVRECIETARLGRLRDRLESAVREITPQARIVAAKAPRLANTSCIALPEAKAETLVIALDLAGVAISAGAACTSGKVTASHVLKAMGLPDETVTGAIRVSLGWASGRDDVDRFIDAWAAVVRPRLAEAAVA